MKLCDLILLNEEQKKLVLLHDGVLVAKRGQPGHIAFLFQIDGYYVEALCNRDSKAVDEFRFFHTTNHLNPYLEAISIQDLLN